MDGYLKLKSSSATKNLHLDKYKEGKKRWFDNGNNKLGYVKCLLLFAVEKLLYNSNVRPSFWQSVWNFWEETWIFECLIKTYTWKWFLKCSNAKVFILNNLLCPLICRSDYKRQKCIFNSCVYKGLVMRSVD